MMTVDMNQTQRAMVQGATAFAKDKLEGIAAELDHTGAYPKALVAGLAANGTLGMLLPEKWGGGDLGFTTYVETVQALSRACPAIVSIVNHHVLAAGVIAQWGTEAQKSGLLPALAKGVRLATYALGETGPTLGVGPEALVATRQNGSLTLKGTKAFVRNAGVADLYVVFATLAEHVTTNGLFACIVEAGAPGISIGPALDTMGLNGCPVAHVTFDGTPVADSAVLKDLSAGPAIIERLLYLAAVAEGAQTVGIAIAAAAHAAGYAAHRVQFHHPIAHQQAVQTMLADMAADSHLAWLGVQDAARLIDEGLPFEVEASMVKSFLARFGMRMLVDGCQVEGGLGISESAPKGVRVALPLARMFRDMAGTTLLDNPGDFPDKLVAASLV
jgi:alkylation response protein AidB-like acyl-CoA dehydrogenase